MRAAICGSARSQVPTAITVACTEWLASTWSSRVARAGSPLPWKVSATMDEVLLPWRTSRAGPLGAGGATVPSDDAAPTGGAVLDELPLGLDAEEAPRAGAPPSSEAGLHAAVSAAAAEARSRSRRESGTGSRYVRATLSGRIGALLWPCLVRWRSGAQLGERA